MIIYTGLDQNLDYCEQASEEIEVHFDGVSRLVIAPTGVNRGTVLRLISTNPQDYLRPEFQPGAEIEFHLALKVNN
ncbi:MAG: YlzJ-like family protein [Candidatus Saccharibacteria bacterium]